MSDSPASRMLQTLQSSSQPATQQMLHGDGQQPQQQDPVPVSEGQTTTSSPPSQLPTTRVSDQQKVDLFESVLNEVAAESATSAQQDTSQQSEPEVQSQVPDPAPQPVVSQPPSQPPTEQPQAYSASPRKEVAPIASAEYGMELPGGLQHVENEPNPEIPDEVGSFLQKVEEDTAHLPEEIVIAAEKSAQNAKQTLPQNVKVLPITKEQEAAGKKKNPSFSIKWLVTFSMKLAEMFKGKAVYRQSQEVNQS